jgi:hypothetical protein
MGTQRVEPDILDVVPWNYGFAHTWVLGWMLRQDDLFIAKWNRRNPARGHGRGGPEGVAKALP